MSNWQNKFMNVATKKDYKIKLEKEELIWPIIVYECEKTNDRFYLEEYDETQVKEIYNKYKEFINGKSQMFSFISKVISDYTECKEFEPKYKEKKFIDKYWTNYIAEFECEEIDSFIVEPLIKMTVQKVLSQRYSINKIKEGARL